MPNKGHVYVYCVYSSHSWRETAEGHWTGVMGGRVWTLTQTDDTIWYHVYKSQDREVDLRRTAPLHLDAKPAMRLKGAIKEEEETVGKTLVQDTEEKEEETLRDYFQLNVKLEDLYKEWGAADPHFKRIGDIFTGLCVYLFKKISNNTASHF